MNRKIEILAPAGSYEGMRAAMNAGCDAVYIGGSSFGARAYANNLDENTLLRAIDEAHLRGKKLYLTVNTLLKEKERTDGLYQFLSRFYLQGLDAVIVQDVGVLHFIHQHFPKLPIHASTQMTLTMAQGAKLLEPYGVTRLVTSRELSLQEIKAIRENTEMEIETFVHGALCYCYSGQCLMSSMIGGRSGNRGRCAQPCRMPYQFYSEGKNLASGQEKYLLSPKDINTLGIIPELVEAGIDSFKIEGRMKRPEYAALTAHLYRKYVDLYLELGRDLYESYLAGKEFEEDMLALQDIYNRGGFSEGYGKNYHGKKMMSLYRPNHSGVYAGKVTDIRGSQVSITLRTKINAQDILEIRHQEEEGYEFTVKDPHYPGEILRTNVGKRPESSKSSDKANSKNKYKEPVIRIGDSVYRTKNNELLEQLEKEYLAKDKKLGIKGYLRARQGERLMLTVSYQDCEATAYQEVVEAALKQPVTKEKLNSQISKTGDTLYYFNKLTIDAEENIFIPVAWLNDIRRDAINLLQEKIIMEYRRDNTQTDPSVKDVDTGISTGGVSVQSVLEAKSNEISENSTFTVPQKVLGINVSVQTQEQFVTALKFSEVTAIYADYDMLEGSDFSTMSQKAKKAGKRFYLALPHICRLGIYERLKKDLYAIIEKEDVNGFLVKNIEELALLRSLFMNKESAEVILNHNMYIYNREAKVFWNEQGVNHFTSPVELNYQELKQLGIDDCDMIVYGYLPLMISAQCLFESTTGCKKCRENNTGFLTDRLGKKFFVQTHCKGCYNIIYNSQATALHKQAAQIIGLEPANIRLDFSVEASKEMVQILSVFIDIYRYGKKNDTEITDYTTGHFKRGAE